MSTLEIKNEIQKIISSVPEDKLFNVLEYLKKIESIIDQENLTEFLRELNSKHGALLSKLAK